ncbi:MAG TPA: phosphatase PAP2 family protein [Gillisia sp.]|nr:phosphatase PAP2 family protein [Gillisia sp.]
MRLKSFLISFLVICINVNSYSQQKRESPYETDLIKDGIWITTGVGLNVLGVLLIQNKPHLSEADLNSLSKDDVWAFDRWAAGNYSEKANSASYIPMFTSYVLPLALLLDEKGRSNAGQLSVLFVESMATTGALFSITAALVEKSRPLVYNTSIPAEERMDNDEQRSFFAGHTASTAAATFFAAKVFHDFYPDSPWKPVVWGVAAAIPATVGYLRIQSGKHFLSDNIVGFAVGAASGILIPEIHKKKNKNVEIYPTMGFNLQGEDVNSQGIGVSYQF